MSMLNYFYDNDLVRIYEEEPKDWREALKISSENLVSKKIIGNKYVDEIISNVEANGAYIVIVPGVVMPHALATSSNVYDTGISFSKFKNPIYFESDNDEKQGKLFFTLAAKDENQHLKNIQNLMDLLLKDDIIEKLSNIDSMEDYLKIMNEF